jgi:RNA polymerase sigma factor (sigma-70 family)
VGASEAEEVAGEAPGLLVVPPKSATAATTLGTWDGRARLSSWLAAITLRRWFARRRATSMSTESLVEPQDRRRAPVAEPLEGLVGGESAQRLLGALDAAWERLTERERLALLLRYRGDLPQTRIAVLLGVGEPRVSRLLGAALERLRAAAGPVLDQAEAQLPGVAAALARWLATRGGYGAPTDVARPSPERSRGP